MLNQLTSRALVSILLLTPYVDAQINFNSAYKYTLDELIDDDAIVKEKNGQATCQFQADEIFVFACQEDTNSPNLMYADTLSVIDQRNCIEGCQAGTERDIGYDFQLEELSFKTDNVIQIQTHEYAASVLVKEGNNYSIVSRYLQQKSNNNKYNKVQLDFFMNDELEISDFYFDQVLLVL